MPNNGIVSTKTNIPDKFRVQSTGQIDASSDMVIVNQPLDGINVTQKSITINQLGQIISSSSTPTAFDVSTSGDLIISKNEGEYGDGPITIQNGDSFTVSNVALPSGLTWRSEYSASTEYSLSDVVFNTVSGVYRTWVYISNTPSTGQALPSGSATSNAYWAQLGTQGPAGTNGVTGVKGNNSVSFLTSNINISPDNIQTTNGSIWTVNSRNNGQSIALSIDKPFREFGFNWRLNGAGTGILPNIIFARTYVNDGLTQATTTLEYDSANQQYVFSFVDGWLNSMFQYSNIVDIRVGEQGLSSFNTDIFRVQYYITYSPNKIYFRIWKFSAGNWVIWTSGSEQPSLSIYIKSYNV